MTSVYISGKIIQNIRKFYRICKFHKIQSMVCPGIQKLPKEQQPPEEILKKFQEAESMEIARDAVQAFSQEELLEAFEKEGISVLPLKGILMKRFYPVTSMRMMADLDILYETGKGKEVEAVLTDLGYYCDHRDSHHDVFFRKPFMNIEMHHCMIGEDSLLDAYYEDIWKRARQEEGKSHSLSAVMGRVFYIVYDRSYGETVFRAADAESALS